MTHLWVRAEPRPQEQRVGLSPKGVAELIASGFTVTVEDDESRIIPIEDFRAAGATIAPAGHWLGADDSAIIFGLKELADDGTPLRHRHIMFGHAYKGQISGARLLDRFRAGGGTLYDLEYLTDDTGRRVAAFGYWAGFVGAALSIAAWGAQQRGQSLGPVDVFASPDALIDVARHAIGSAKPSVIIIGALGRVGTGAWDVAKRLGVPVTPWDQAETANGGPFPAILTHDVFLNCILASPGVPVFVPTSALQAARKLQVIGDIACDPDSDYSPVPLYDSATTWADPVVRVADMPPMDIMAIDNLPSLLPRESSEDFSNQLLPYLKTLDDMTTGVWGRAAAEFARHI